MLLAPELAPVELSRARRNGALNFLIPVDVIGCAKLMKRYGTVYAHSLLEPAFSDYFTKLMNFLPSDFARIWKNRLTVLRNDQEMLWNISGCSPRRTVGLISKMMMKVDPFGEMDGKGSPCSSVCELNCDQMFHCFDTAHCFAQKSGFCVETQKLGLDIYNFNLRTYPGDHI